MDFSTWIDTMDRMDIDRFILSILHIHVE